MFIEDRIGTLLAALIIAFTWSIPATALATDIPNNLQSEGPVWLWSDSAPYSNATAKALSDGDTRLGLRLANKALTNATEKRDRLIAHHNLCVAHATKARTTTAMRHCQEARRLADSGFVIATGLNATQVLDQNLTLLGLPDFGQIRR